MENPILIETGAQLLARLMHRPSPNGLETVLLADGVRHNEVIEISGNLSSGKTLLITQLLAKCILPKRWRGVEMNGLGGGAVLINTDHHFQILTLFNLMRSIIRNSFNKFGIKFEEETARILIEESLGYLTVLNCYDAAQFTLACQMLENILSVDDKIAIIAVDSISTYYWHDRSNGIAWSMDGYLKTCLKQIQKYTFHHKVVIIYTRPHDFETKGKEPGECAALPEEEKVNHRIQLLRTEPNNEFTASVESAVKKRNFSYSISDNGMKWKRKE